jgi:hypothetical protein
MVTKPAKEFTDAQGRRKVKGNMDMELAIDMLQMCENLDHVVLFSGDGDFRSLAEAVQRKGVRVTVVSTIKTSPPMVADELRRQADTFIELQSLAQLIARNFHNQRPAPARAPVPAREPVEELEEEDYEDDEDFDDEDYEDDEEDGDYEDDDDEATVERTTPKS